MEWVKNNIAAFGGDVDRIVIFGESAGAAGVDFYNYAWTSDPIIAGSIMASGSTNLGQARSATTAANLWNNLAVAAGCNGTDAAILACMRTIPIDAFIAADTAVSGGGYAAGPTVDVCLHIMHYERRLRLTMSCRISPFTQIIPTS